MDEAIKKLGDGFKKALPSLTEFIENICKAYVNVFENIKDKIFIFEKMKISRKRFVKLLMSIGYQRNEANKIAWRYHAEKGRYTFLDFIKESNK
jgi:hypothetical protein